MGLQVFSSSEYEEPSAILSIVNKKIPNPDPTNYRIIKSEVWGVYLIIKINYPECTNYEGNKILLYKNTSLEELIRQGSIDPHFCKNDNYHSPIARFEPTEQGWNMALLIAKRM